MEQYFNMILFLLLNTTIWNVCYFVDDFFFNTKKTNMTFPNIIIALDSDNCEELVKKLNPNECLLKVGKALFIRLGPKFVKNLVSKGFKVFLDLKLHDIPMQVEKAITECCKLGVYIISIHSLGGIKMMQAARRAVDNFDSPSRPLLLAVTMLTSLESCDLEDIGFYKTMEQNVLHLAKLSKLYGIDGVVCSGQEAIIIRRHCGDSFIIVTPGIRLSSNQLLGFQDQKRVVSPSDAISFGSNFLVIGRDITGSDDPVQTLQKINQSLQSYL
jgi:orotidine-5'-phosphate decarboxylase